jgi:type I restriction enzyme S subunit
LLNHLRESGGLNAFENQSASNIINFAFTEFTNRLEVLVPPDEVLLSFEQIITPILQQMGTIAETQERFREARDLLLPKLMSGALDVSRITLPKEVAA